MGNVSGWDFILAAVAGLIGLAAVPSLRSKPRSLLFAIATLAIIGLFGKGVYQLATMPKPWANVALHCILDGRTTGTATHSDGLPKYAVYITGTGTGGVTVKSGEQPQYDLESGAMYQLAGESFLRCKLVNQRPAALTNVAVSLQSKFIRRPDPNGRPYIYDLSGAKETTVLADIINAGDTFDFAIINFGKSLLFVRGATISADGFSTLLSNVETNDATKALLSGSLTLDPQRTKRTPWIFDDKCIYNLSVPIGIPMAQAMKLMTNWMVHFMRHPPPGCSPAAYRAWKARAEAEQKKYEDSLNH